jgi:hypothetical protein
MTPVLQFTEASHSSEPAIFARVRLRARRRVRWLRSLWSSDQNIRSLAITDDEADRLLSDPGELRQAEAAFYGSNAEARELTRHIAAADAEAESEPRWNDLRRIFDLSRPEADLLALATIAAADPGFARICGYLHDDANACHATQLLAGALFEWPTPFLVTANSALARWKLAFIPDTALASSAPNPQWIADPHIVQWLCIGAGIDPVLDRAASLISRSLIAGLECLYPSTRQAAIDFIAGMRGGPEAELPLEIELVAPPGAGKRTLAAQICSAFGSGLLVVDTPALMPKELSSTQYGERILRAARTARINGTALYWSHAELLDSGLRSALTGLCDLTFFGSETPLDRRTQTQAAVSAFELDTLKASQRVRLWERDSSEPPPAPIPEWELQPAEIRSAAQIAYADPEAVKSACRQMRRRSPGELLTALQCPYTWHDIVLPGVVRQQLGELVAQSHLGAEVLDGWGFERLCRMSRGISALFAGPSGTGKTMAAQVLARELDRELLRVDLAGVVNKYIGETEKRLKQVFDSCERSSAVLFFDEADALFGQRTQVKESHDRYANIQIDYLLQRIEQFDGIAILATNRKNDLDNAFIRRLRFIVDFFPPGPAERLTLWQLSLPERSPSGEELLDGIDWEWLAANMVMTGAEIKSTALAAAFLARAQGSRIQQEHLVHAARREMAKHGSNWRAANWEGKAHG